MVMRWLIRGVCLALLTGVVGVWAGSYAGAFEMDKRAAGRDWSAVTVHGLGCMVRSERDVSAYPTRPLQFEFRRGWTAEDFGLPPGFICMPTLPWRPDSWQIIFPLWLPALLLVVLNGLVWRWTRRRKVGVGVRGFPIEPAKKADA
jgi:hypothetical protein